MDAQSLIHRYRDRLAWSSEETQTVVSEFIDRNDLLDDLKQFLIEETGIDLSEAEDTIAYLGQPFSVLAFGAGSNGRKADERIDTDSEIMALEAFSKLLNRPDLEHFIIVQFRSGSEASRELLRYDRRTSVKDW